MRAGQLKHRVDIEALADGYDDYGDFVESWSAVYVSVPVAIKPVSGSQKNGEGEVDSIVTHELKMRYLPGITPKNRIKYGSRYFDIHSAVNFQEGNRDLLLKCVERV